MALLQTPTLVSGGNQGASSGSIDNSTDLRVVWAGNVGAGFASDAGNEIKFRWASSTALLELNRSAASPKLPIRLTSVSAVAWTQNVDDTLALADALAFDRAVVLADTASVADAVAFGRALALMDTVALADARGFDRGLGLADAATVADALSLDRALALADTVALDDLLSAALGHEVTVVDAVALDDGLVFDRGLAVTDPLGLADVLVFDRTLTLSESLAVSDFADVASSGAAPAPSHALSWHLHRFGVST